jgi:hypothetical protein
MSRRDEEDIEVCSRSIDLWGRFFIDCYIVACQAFFLFLLYYPKIQQVKCQRCIKWVADQAINVDNFMPCAEPDA